VIVSSIGGTEASEGSWLCAMIGGAGPSIPCSLERRGDWQSGNAMSPHDVSPDCLVSLRSTASTGKRLAKSKSDKLTVTELWRLSRRATRLAYAPEVVLVLTDTRVVNGVLEDEMDSSTVIVLRFERQSEECVEMEEFAAVKLSILDNELGEFGTVLLRIPSTGSDIEEDMVLRVAKPVASRSLGR
jgi:hypothetical protein